MTTIGAIDIGSNAMRLAVASIGNRGSLRVIETIRDPVRLGGDVFAGKPISDVTMDHAIEALKRFKRVMHKWGVTSYRAVATSALREAINNAQFLHRVAASVGTDIQIISGEEEARLIHHAVAHSVNLEKKLALLIDIGGGSAEISVVRGATIIAAETFALGAVRILQAFDNRIGAAKDFPKLVREYTGAARRRLAKEIGNRRITLCVGTGGNIECLRDLKTRVLGKPDSLIISREDIHALLGILQSHTLASRVRRLGLRPDRADVIVPASMVLEHLMDLAGQTSVRVPGVGVREGILWDLIPDALGKRAALEEKQVVFSAHELGERYRYDAKHGAIVAGFALQLFDATKSIHGLGPNERVLLEVASILHDIGHVVSATGHHKHSAYLIASSPLIGLDIEQQILVSMIARYHRKSIPKISHEPFAALMPRQRSVVVKLTALLRIADALDCEHAGRVRSIRLVRRNNALILHLTGTGNLLLERWSLNRSKEMFEQVYPLTLTVQP